MHGQFLSLLSFTILCSCLLIIIVAHVLDSVNRVLITSMEDQDTQVYCEGWDDYQEEPTHPGVYYTLKQRANGTHSAVCYYCGKKWVSTE